MNGSQHDAAEARVLVLAPTPRDAALTRTILAQAGIDAYCCADLACLCEEIEVGAGALLLAEEAIGRGRGVRLAECLARQAPWSDLPVLLLARPGTDSAAVNQAIAQFGNVIVLERPTRITALLSVVRTALSSRRRQYQARSLLEEQARNQAELREADRRKDEFLATLAHELRNPLAPIRNSLHVLRLANGHDPTTAAVGEMIERQVNHMVRLVDDLLEVSRITRGKIELRQEPLLLAEVITAALETSQPLIEAAGHRLQLVLPVEPLPLRGDPVRLAQVFANLLNNSAKYTDAGGQISLQVRREDGQAVARVRDNGMGIAAETLPRVFDLFMQNDGRAERAQGGLGIGLTLARTLVEMHGGSIEAHSAGLGQGSEFVVRLPLAGTAAPAAAALDQSHPPAAGLRPRRVLVVDDNRDAAESLGILLRLFGAEVQVVDSGAAALDALDTTWPSVVLLDLGMPGMDGYEVARRIRARPGGDTIVLIALTGWGQADDRRRTREAGFDHHLVKPADVAELKALLASLDQGAAVAVVDAGPTSDELLAGDRE